MLGAATFTGPAEAGAPWLSFDAGGWSTRPLAINARSDIAGVYFDFVDVSHGFLRTGDGAVTTFDPPDATFGTVANCLNGKGEIAGAYSFFDNDGNEYSNGFVRHPDGTFEEFNVGGLRSVGVLAMNNSGSVVGYAENDSNSEIAFLRRKNGTVTMLLTNFEESSANDINTAGEIVGNYLHHGVWHGFIREPDGHRIMFDPPGSIYTYAVKINDSGEIAGSYLTSDYGYHGFLREPDGAFATFDIAGAKTRTGPDITGIDPDGNIVGSYSDQNFYDQGFVRDHAGNIHFVTVPGEISTHISGISRQGKLTGFDSDAHGFRGYPKVWQRQ
ncbi:MAG TPA: hypothetical protein VMF58_08885 [Rhizomicrobium sp.]|nr:hypothetical protein [Rhizomicrobium sp.]